MTSPLPQDLLLAKELVYDKCGWPLSNFRLHTESQEYSACNFTLNNYQIQYREARITPTKAGLFVTIWKRNDQGITAPFDIADDIDFLVITTRNGARFGQFIFPKSVLAARAVFTDNGKDGKRGIRVYPPWDVELNKQAVNTQAWQATFFLKIDTLVDMHDVKLKFLHP
ncbi:MepB family protein [uncultured Chitinophaga sp.]|uniref:MepB family protein n=1 Tax=uncultured Chitinophaga sp. TaxID=339340 RepID=UPI0025FE687C|nr:MepB family protein [uncultured Chitinophaga sp.]